MHRGTPPAASVWRVFWLLAPYVNALPSKGSEQRHLLGLRRAPILEAYAMVREGVPTDLAAALHTAVDALPVSR